MGEPPSLHVVADAGYSNGAQAAACEARGIVPHVPAQRGVNNRGDGTLFDRNQFRYDAASDTFRCPGRANAAPHASGQKTNMSTVYAAPRTCCGNCALKSRCTTAPQRYVYLHLHEAALAAHERTRHSSRDAAQTMHGRASLRGLEIPHLRPSALPAARRGRSQIEIGLGTMVYNLKRMINVLGGAKLINALQG